MLLSGFNKRVLLPDSRFAEMEAPERTIPDSPGFHTEWVQACRDEGAATYDFAYSGPLAETVLLGNLAYRAGEFDWDAQSMSTDSIRKAQALLRTEYRCGWQP